MDKFSEKLKYDFSVNIIVALIVVVLFSIRDYLVAALIFIFPILQNVYYQLVSQIDPTLPAYISIVFVIAIWFMYLNNESNKFLEKQYEIKNKYKGPVKISEEDYLKENDSEIKRTKRYIRMLHLGAFLFLIMFIFAFNASELNYLLFRRITNMSYKISQKEFNFLNAKRFNMQNKRDYLILDSLINYYTALPDTSKISN